MRQHLVSIVEDFRRHADETAIVSHRGVRRHATSYGELAQLAGRFSAELIRRNILPGERVVLWGENSAEWVGAFFGCLLRGVLAVPLDASGSASFAGRILDEVRPRLVLGDADRLQLLATDVPILDFSQLSLPAEPDFSVSPTVEESAPFQIIFTSGTTSEPKGIVHTHRNVLASLRPIEAEIAKYRKYERWVHPLRFLHTLPLSHVFGQFMGLWIPAVLGAELHFTDVLESGRVLQLIRRERVSVLIAVPRVLSLLRAHLLALFPALGAEIDRASRLSALKRWWHFRKVHALFGWKFWAAISGGASLPRDLEVFWNRLGFALIQGYGMTETAALVTLNHPFRIGQGTIGKALPGREVRLSESGEILVRGDMVAGSTWQGGGLVERKGEWLATGDLAEQNESGEFRFVGRKGDTIVSSSGLNIFPADLEAAVTRQPGVKACAVVPCDCQSGPEAVCVVIFSGGDAALQQAVSAANKELAEYQQIRRVLRWPEFAFPYTSSGKLLRRSVREWACRALSGKAAGSISGDTLLEMIAAVTGSPVADGDEELHLDSLGRVQLASMIEQRTGVWISDTTMASIDTVGQLRGMIGDSAATVSAPASIENATSRSDQPTRSHVYPRWPWSAPVQLLRVLCLEAVVRPLIALFLAPRVIRPEQALPKGPLLIIANHVTLLDGPLVLYALPAHLRRRVAIAMSGEMLLEFRSGGGNGIVAGLAKQAAYWLLTALFNVFPLPRLQGFRQSFAHAGDAIDRDFSVLIFPEGARSSDGQLAPFRQGIGLLAEQAEVYVLPVALLGLERIAAKKAKWFRTGRLEVRIGNAFPWTPSTSPAEWTAELEAAIKSLRA
jgi:long-chain acyl-CoA synthetase